MPITPRDSPSGQPAAELDAGEPKEPGTGEGPPITRSPNVSIAPAPPPAADSHEAPTSSDNDGRGRVRPGEVFDLGERGRYTVKECLGCGGMGEVYRAEYVAADGEEGVHVFALKVLRPDAHPRHARDLIDEVHLLSALCHEHIARYHDFFVHNGRQVLVMEYVEGRSLHAILDLARRKGRKLSEATSLELLAQVADALGYAHAAKDGEGYPLNIIHRDVSPSNIMVNSAGHAVLIDFGVAKADLEEQTQTASNMLSIRGKPAYVAPEQVLMQPVDGRADLFAVGSILVEMQTGEPPFGRAPAVGTLIFTVLVTRKHVDNLTRGLSDKVRAICRKALAFDPGRRFADGGEMAAAMRADLPCRGPEAVMEEIAALEALPDAPPMAPPAALPDVPSKALERVERALRGANQPRRALAAIAALVCAAAACFFVWSAYSSRPTAGDQAKPEAATATVQQTAAAAKPTGSAGGPAVPLAQVCAMMPGCAPILTGTTAGDCYRVVQHGFPGIVVPDVMYVALDESNPEGPCTGKWDDGHFARDEPCPVYDEKDIIMRIMGEEVEERPWYGPPGRDGPAPSLLIGTTTIFDATGEYQSDFGHPLRDYRQRMTALITEIRTYDGHSVPVCGVLFGEDDKEGVPIFRSPKDGKPFGGAWGKARVKFFWPDKKE